MGTSLKLLVLKTRQIEKLRAFYQAIGVNSAVEKHGDGPLHYAGQVEKTTIEIYPLPDGIEQADAKTRLGFAVADLTQVVKELEVLGLSAKEPQQTPWGLRVVVRDPDGRAVELYQE